MCSAYIQSFSLLVHFSDVNFFFHGPTDRPTFGIIEAPVPELKNSRFQSEKANGNTKKVGKIHEIFGLAQFQEG